MLSCAKVSNITRLLGSTTQLSN